MAPETIPISPFQPDWSCLQAGARDVWDAVQPLLERFDEPGGAPQ